MSQLPYRLRYAARLLTLGTIASGNNASGCPHPLRQFRILLTLHEEVTLSFHFFFYRVPKEWQTMQLTCSDCSFEISLIRVYTESGLNVGFDSKVCPFFTWCSVLVNSLTTKKADDKIFVCTFSNNIKSKLYHIENSKTRGQKV